AVLARHAQSPCRRVSPPHYANWQHFAPPCSSSIALPRLHTASFATLLRLYNCCEADPSAPAPRSKYVQRRPTLLRGRPGSPLRAEGLNFRVWNVAGCFPFAMAAETLWRYQSVPDRISGTSQWTLSRVVRNKPSAY